MNQRLAALVLLVVLGFVSPASAGTITDAAAQPPGTAVTINDALLLSTVDLIPDGSYRSFQLRDSTRAITVYGTNAEIAAALTGWTAGDGINISGLTASRDGALCLDSLPPGHPLGAGGVGGFAVTGRNGTGPFPFPTHAVTVAPSDISGGHESDLVCLQDVWFDTADGTAVFAAETNYWVNAKNSAHATEQLHLRIATADLGLAGLPIPTGPVDITGIVLPDPAGAGYVLAPRGPGDMVSVPEPASLALGLGGLGLLLIRRGIKSGVARGRR